MVSDTYRWVGGSPPASPLLVVASDEQLVVEAVEAQRQAETAEAEAGSEHRWRTADAYAELARRGWTQQRTAAAVGVNQSTISRYLSCALVYAVPHSRPTFWHAYAEVTGERRGIGVHGSSETPEWETPQALFDLLDAEFGFTLDVCATHENAKCEAHYTARDDGLAREWSGVCWMNPPYGDEIAEWMRKAHESAKDGATVVCLVPARTDTGWWWEHARYGEIRFLRGRLRFGGGESGAPFPSAIVVLGRPASVVWWEAWPTA